MKNGDYVLYSGYPYANELMEVIDASKGIYRMEDGHSFYGYSSNIVACGRKDKISGMAKQIQYMKSVYVRAFPKDTSRFTVAVHEYIKQELANA